MAECCSGAAIGGTIGLTGGAATAYIAAGSVMASTGAVKEAGAKIEFVK